ncbi:helix-turn-helix transcriptional regulator [Mesorhizobium ventifaucium]|uniref:HTH araC/xylS-type domain-containing protein n=1 Tax=Mesorhizobium ventifaucium TaxID=666020 RepID=A0ABN8JNV8_9HYPH|nr:helix-turn-helix transcriptional regulator [Mesorhizobium ventifaucium]CAH2399067.1 hypothetical protein MES4922_210056 [Mesorhizobium ventifaucium]
MATGLSCYIHRFIPWEPIDHQRREPRGSGRDRILQIMDSLGRLRPAPSLGELADAEGVTVSHLSRLFRARTGISFRDYVQSIKIDAVVEDLLTTTETVLNIMSARGIGNPSLFYHRFRERFGCSPLQFRQRAHSIVTNSQLPDDSYKAAFARLQSYMANMAWASDITFGLPATRDYVAVAALHQTPSLRPAASSPAGR